MSHTQRISEVFDFMYDQQPGLTQLEYCEQSREQYPPQWDDEGYRLECDACFRAGIGRKVRLQRRHGDNAIHAVRNGETEKPVDRLWPEQQMTAEHWRKHIQGTLIPNAARTVTRLAEAEQKYRAAGGRVSFGDDIRRIVEALSAVA